MTFRTGYLTLFRIYGAPVRVHWTTPVGAYLFTGAAFVPGAWLGFVLVVLVHELGHAALVQRFGQHTVSIDLHAVGGECRWVGQASERQRAAIAWGGVLAQLALLLVTPLWGDLLSQPLHPFVAQLVSALTATNLLLIAINLLPVAPLDGAEAWRFFTLRGSLSSSSRQAALEAQARDIERQLDALAKEREREAPRPDRSQLN